jgi:thiol-disulfide isomerase/thioredoxin
MFVLAAALAAGLGLVSADEASKFTPVDGGASNLAGYFTPVPLTLSNEQPAGVKKLPADVATPRFAVLPVQTVDGHPISLVLDEAPGKAPRLFVDADGNGDLTNDALAEWNAIKNQSNGSAAKVFYLGGADVETGTTDAKRRVHLLFYRFDSEDPTRAEEKNKVFVYRDFGLSGEVKIGEKTYKAMLMDDGITGDYRGKPGISESSGVSLLVDINADGKFERRGEVFDIRKPFSVEGQTYEAVEVAKDGSSLKVVKSDKKLETPRSRKEANVGKEATKFEAVNMDGKAIKFPGDYKGKVVLLDFWATWCGPCMAEVPNVVSAYAKYHDKGFEVLGVSLDRENAEEKIRSVLAQKQMAWPQIYDGLFWKARIAELYSVKSIPATYLVDGDTGAVLAVGARGERLAQAVEKALADKAAKK